MGGEEAEGVRWEWEGGLGWEGWVGVAIFGGVRVGGRGVVWEGVMLGRIAVMDWVG